MSRYNHRILEKKWLVQAAQHDHTWENTVYVRLVPSDSGNLSFENVRLLLLADFFGFSYLGYQPKIALDKGESLPGSEAMALGLRVSDHFQSTKSQLAVLPRDFAHLSEDFTWNRQVLIGRFHGEASLQELLPDFGLDALRIYFLYLGPPERNYSYDWYGLPSAYRFVQKIWFLYQNVRSTSDKKSSAMGQLQEKVYERLNKQKPHTALAAIMEFLQTIKFLSKADLVFLAHLLKPFTPILAREILSLDTDDPR